MEGNLRLEDLPDGELGELVLLGYRRDVSRVTKALDDYVSTFVSAQCDRLAFELIDLRL